MGSILEPPKDAGLSAEGERALEPLRPTGVGQQGSSRPAAEPD